MSGFNPEITTLAQDWLMRKFYYRTNGGTKGAPTSWLPKKRYIDPKYKSKFSTDGRGNVAYSDQFDYLFSGGRPQPIQDPLDFVMVKRRRGLIVKYMLEHPQEQGTKNLKDANANFQTGNLPTADKFSRWYNALLNDRQFKAKMQILACKELNATAMKRAANKFAREDACSMQYRERDDAFEAFQKKDSSAIRIPPIVPAFTLPVTTDNIERPRIVAPPRTPVEGRYSLRPRGPDMRVTRALKRIREEDDDDNASKRLRNN